MRAYADSSFILHLVSAESGSAAVISQYRRLELPSLFFLWLHRLEVRNAILQKAFFERRSVPSGERGQVARQRDAALSRIEHFLKRRTLVDVTLDLEEAVSCASSLSSAHTEQLGTRAIDILHVACAITLESEVFLTTDARQNQLASAEGLKVIKVEIN